MKEFSRCPSCGCAVDEMLRGHHSAADCSILKYGEREAVEALAQAEENIWRWLCGETLDNYPLSRAKLHAAMLADEPRLNAASRRPVIGVDTVFDPTKLSIERMPDSGRKAVLDENGELLYCFPRVMSDAHIRLAIDFAYLMSTSHSEIRS